MSTKNLSEIPRNQSKLIIVDSSLFAPSEITFSIFIITRKLTWRVPWINPLFFMQNGSCLAFCNLNLFPMKRRLTYAALPSTHLLIFKVKVPLILSTRLWGFFSLFDFKYTSPLVKKKSNKGGLEWSYIKRLQRWPSWQPRANKNDYGAKTRPFPIKIAQGQYKTTACKQPLPRGQRIACWALTNNNNKINKNMGSVFFNVLQFMQVTC